MLNRNAWIAVAAASAIALIVGFGIGAMVSGGDAEALPPTTAGGSTPDEATVSTPVETVEDLTTPTKADAETGTEPGQIPSYGSVVDREALISAAETLNITGIFADPEVLLATADKVCYDLDRLLAQDRSPAYATRVVWNESLAELESKDLAGFATAFNLAPTFLCPQTASYAEDVGYILGF